MRGENMKKLIIGKKDGDIALNQLSKTLEGLEVGFRNPNKGAQSEKKDKTTKKR